MTVNLPSAIPSFEQHLSFATDDALEDDAEDSLHYQLSTLLVGVGGLLRDALAQLRYVGPLRALHQRDDTDRKRPTERAWQEAMKHLGLRMPMRTLDAGAGISQVLPVVVAAIDPNRPAITAIEQPELHLHPKIQVELGDLFAQQTDKGGIFLIETHSEHFLLRFMRRMRQTSDGTLDEGAPEVRPEDIAVLFVEIDPDGEQTLVREMPLNERGELVEAWPGGFFEEDLREIF